jgi:hypothetical protein
MRNGSDGFPNKLIVKRVPTCRLSGEGRDLPAASATTEVATDISLYRPRQIRLADVGSGIRLVSPEAKPQLRITDKLPKRIMIIWILAVGLLAVAVPSQAAVAVRVLLGVGDQAETDWSGGLAAQGAAIAAVEPWRFDGGDVMLPGNRWKMTSRRIRLFGAAATPPAANAPRLQFAPITPVNRPCNPSRCIAHDQDGAFERLSMNPPGWGVS